MARFTALEREPNSLSGSLELGRESFNFYFSSPEGVSDAPDPLLPVGLLLAMTAGEPLDLPDGVSPRLLTATRQIQDILHVWDPAFARADVVTKPRPPGEARGERVGCFFSGGVDSFYTAVKNHDEITDLIFCIGMDLLVTGDPELLRKALSGAERSASALGKRLVVVHTNIRACSDRYLSGYFFYGALLASVGLLFQDRFRKLLVPSTHTYAELFPCGSHPLLDPLWATEETEFVHDGAEATRPEKVQLISSNEVAMDNLRVCFENRASEVNCGRCEKCIRTMIALRTAGTLERCRTFPSEIDLKIVARLDMRRPNENVRSFAVENVEALERSGADPALEHALRLAIKRGGRIDPTRTIRSVRAKAERRLRSEVSARAPGLTRLLKGLRRSSVR